MQKAVPLAAAVSDGWLDIHEVMAKMGWRARSTVYDWIANRNFPKPRKGSARWMRWSEAEVDSYISQLPLGGSIKEAA